MKEVNSLRNTYLRLLLSLKKAEEIEFTEEEIAEFRECFSLYDKDGDGKITANELAPVMRAIGMNPTEDELQERARTIDRNHNGCIEFAGFIQMNAELWRENAAEKSDESYLKDAFKTFDLNGSGLIPCDKLREAMLTLGEKLTEEEVDEMIQLGDRNKEGEVNYEELSAAMLSN